MGEKTDAEKNMRDQLKKILRGIYPTSKGEHLDFIADRVATSIESVVDERIAAPCAPQDDKEDR